MTSLKYDIKLHVIISTSLIAIISLAVYLILNSGQAKYEQTYRTGIPPSHMNNLQFKKIPKKVLMLAQLHHIREAANSCIPVSQTVLFGDLIIISTTSNIKDCIATKQAKAELLMFPELTSFKTIKRTKHLNILFSFLLFFSLTLTLHYIKKNYFS